MSPAAMPAAVIPHSGHARVRVQVQSLVSGSMSLIAAAYAVAGGRDASRWDADGRGPAVR